MGFGVAEALVEHGASVIISSSSRDRVANAVRCLEDAYPSAKGRIQGLACNLSSQEQLEVEVEKLLSDATKGGKLDHVVHTAGDALTIKPLEDCSLDQILQAGMVRFFSPLIVAKHLPKYLNEGPAASFTMTTGSSSERPSKNWSAIIPYLKGLEGMCRALALDLAPIRVNLVNVGAVETELWDGFKKAGIFDEMKKSFAAKMTTGVVGKVEDVAESYLYCMKDKNITGSMIVTNGGWLLL